MIRNDTRKKSNRIPDLVSLSISPISTYTSLATGWIFDNSLPSTIPFLHDQDFHLEYFHIISTQGRDIKNIRRRNNRETNKRLERSCFLSLPRIEYLFTCVSRDHPLRPTNWTNRRHRCDLPSVHLQSETALTFPSFVAMRSINLTARVGRVNETGRESEWERERRVEF